MDNIAIQPDGLGRWLMRKACREKRIVASNGKESYFPLQVSLFW